MPTPELISRGGTRLEPLGVLWERIIIGLDAVMVFCPEGKLGHACYSGASVDVDVAPIAGLKLLTETLLYIHESSLRGTTLPLVAPCYQEIHIITVNINHHGADSLDSIINNKGTLLMSYVTDLFDVESEAASHAGPVDNYQSGVLIDCFLHVFPHNSTILVLYHPEINTVFAESKERVTSAGVCLISYHHVVAFPPRLIIAEDVLDQV